MSDSPASVSVVMAAYNPRKYLAETLDSIAAQTRPPEEVIIVDDASTEPFDDILRPFEQREDFPPLRVIRQPRNMGQAVARNTGMDAARGECIAFLDSDDVWHPRHLESSLANLADPAVTLSFAPAMMFRDGGMDRPLHTIRPMFPGEAAYEPLALLRRCFIILSSVVVRAEAMKTAGRFDESPDLRVSEDLNSFMNLLRSGAVFRITDEPTLYYRKHPDSATCRPGHVSRQSCRVVERHIGWVPGAPRRKRKLLARTYWRAAFQLRRAGAEDHGAYLGKAFRLSLTHPLFLVRRMWKYGSGLMNHSDAGAE